jgi:hypothetical protein
MKKFPILISTTILAAFGMMLSACNLPTNRTTQTPGPEQVYTAAAQTVAASITKIPPTATAKPNPTATQQLQVTLSPGPVINPATVTPSAPCDQAEFVSDVTVPDDTLVSPGSAFTKTWKLQNVGSCPWTTAYKLVFDSGDAMNGPTAMNLPSSVGPGQVMDLSVNLTAPSQPGSYQGFWRLQNLTGGKFGLKSNRNGPFWVKIKVGASTAFAVNGVNVNVDTSSYSGVCPHTFNLSGTMNASTAGKATYFWEFSDGAKSAIQEMNFTEAASKAVSYTWTISTSGNYWAKIYVDQPNHQYFPQVNFTVTCNP